MATSGSRDFEPDVAEYVEEAFVAVLSIVRDTTGIRPVVP